jgi:biotin transport system substrate-specific component
MIEPKIKIFLLCAFFAALSAVLSQLFIPLGPVPVNFTHVSVFMAAGLLGAKYGALSQVIFVLMGAAGIPVFTGLTGGLGIVFGPTGGFIIGYIVCAYIVGLIAGHWGYSVKALASAMYAGWAVTYICGVAWFMYVTQMSFIAALPVCVLPFLPGDALKTIISIMLIKRLRLFVNR